MYACLVLPPSLLLAANYSMRVVCSTGYVVFCRVCNLVIIVPKGIDSSEHLKDVLCRFVCNSHLVVFTMLLAGSAIRFDK